MRTTGKISARHRGTYVEFGLVGLLAFTAMVSVPGCSSYLTRVATDFVANLHAV